MKNITEQIQKILNEIHGIAKKENISTAFVIGNTVGGDGKKIRFFPIRKTSSIVFGVLNIYSIEEAKKATNFIDGKVDFIFVDVEKKQNFVNDLENALRKVVKKSEVFSIKLNDMTVDAADALISQFFGNVYGKKVAILGVGNLGSKIAIKMVERGANVSISRRDVEKARKIADGINIIKNKYSKSVVTAFSDNYEASKGSDVVIGCTPRTPVITKKMVANMKQGSCIIDVGIGTIFPDAIELANKRGIDILRLDMRSGFSGGITTVIETDEMLKNITGKRDISGVNIVAGGYIGKKGDIIVDRISNPTKIIGVADGVGGILPDSGEFKDRLQKLRTIIEGKKPDGEQSSP